MELESYPNEEIKREELPTAEAFHIGGRENAVICPICGHQEHAPKIGETGGIKNCETFEHFDKIKPRQYIVTKRAA
ncbi:MAG: hypothetical protein WC437_00500 [Patescibacteria group bacterium]|jgi:hypothetical protein|nr:hypothetical protein [Patescibacteria group bacterium]